jgi:peptidyl-prolyl cis-trans isomerase D
MAIISKIREYSGVAIFFIAISIIAFVLTDFLGGGLFGGQKQYIGKINGQSVEYAAYDAQLKQSINNYRQQTGQNPQDAQLNGIRDQVWNSFIFEYAYTSEFEKLELSVGDEELYQMVQGDSLFIHPQIRQQFTDPQTGVFNKNAVVEFLKTLGQRPVEQQAQWAAFEDGIRKSRMQSKYEGLIRMSSYVTTAEAEREYTNQSSKAEVKYVYVPYSSIVDSTLTSQITDEMLKEELKANPNKYEAQETRSLDYVVFDVNPSAADSAAFYTEIKAIAKDFAKAPNDSAFMMINSDNASEYAFKPVGQIPTILFDKNPAILKGGIYGPYIDGKAYKIFKVSDVKEDSVEYVRARHILFKADQQSTPEQKDEARKQANDVLTQLKGGTSFAEMAAKYGQDGTAQRGGDLGWYGRGQMVSPFEQATFGVQNPGLLPNLVETDFGFHIIEVTQPANKTAYKIATIEMILEPSEETLNEALYKAEELKLAGETGDKLREEVGKNTQLVLLNANKLSNTASNLGAIQGAREVIRWAFNDASVGDVSEVFNIQEQNKYIIATLTEKTSKGDSDIEIFREELTAAVAKKLKSEQITKKLNANKGKSLDDMAKSYGTEALVSTANDISLGSNVLSNTGFNPVAIGKTFGLKKGKRTDAFADETGVMVLELVNLTPAAKIADYSKYKNDIETRLNQRIQFLIAEAIKKAAYIEDERYKFY